MEDAEMIVEHPLPDDLVELIAQRFRALGLECLITAGNHAKAVRALPGVPEGLVFSGIEEAVWAALQIVSD